MINMKNNNLSGNIDEKVDKNTKIFVYSLLGITIFLLVSGIFISFIN